MNKIIRHRKNKGEKMSLRKITTLLLLAAFALTVVPVQAATLTTVAPLPNVLVDAGSIAVGANRDVVPVNISVDTLVGGEVVFGTYTGTGTFAITENGQLTTGGATLVPATSTKVLVLEPPVGTDFVGLSGYVDNVTTAVMDPAAGGNTGSLVNVTTSNLPGTGNEDTAILAKIISEAGPASTFGTTIPAGSIVIYTITNSGSNQSTGESDITLQNIGLATEPGVTLADLATRYRQVIVGVTVNEAVPSLSNGDLVTIATNTTDTNGQIAVALDSTEPDAQSNSVLADLLAAGQTAVKVSTNYITTTTNNQTTLYVDTDALLIQAGPIPGSGTVYYETPFNTSSFLSSTENGNDFAVLNADLTNATAFPNTANALITVTYSLMPLTGNGTTDATLVLDAASVALSDLGTNGGYLGSLSVNPVVDGGAIDRTHFAVGVLYNGESATGVLPVVDFDYFADAVTNVTTDAGIVGFDFTAHPEPLAVTSAIATPFVNTNGNLLTGLFPGVSVGQADDITTANDGVIQNGNALTNVVNATGFMGATIGERLWVANEVNVRLVPTGGNAIFALIGNENGTALNGVDSDLIKLGPTNTAAVPYNNGASLQKGPADEGVSNNVIAAAKLTGNSVQIMPLTNKLDNQRDVIKVRPEATITLGATSRAQGVKLVATVTGNNIAGSKVVELARINAAGATDVAATVQGLPAAGTLNRLLAENGENSASLRVAVDISTVNTTNTSVSSLIANGSVLDDTLPSFFCGGSAGTIVNGPNSVPQQPYARAIFVEESTAGSLDTAFVGGGNDVIRFTMPVGVDLVKIATGVPATSVVNVISTDGGGAGTFSVSPAVTDYQTISEQNGGQAFIDVSYSTAVAGTGADTVRKALALVFGAYSLVIPEDQADLDVTVTVVNDDGTSAVANDTVLDTIGTAPLATGCAEQFTISYCDDALAEFGQASGPVESNVIANGSLLTSFSSPTSSTIRLLTTSGPAADFRIPDICVTEAVNDALFVGPTATTPNIFGPGQNISLAISDSSDENDNTNDVGFAAAGAIFTSDDSVSFGAPGIGGDLINSVITAGANGDDFQVMTKIRFTEINLGETNNVFQPSLQNITVFTNDGADHIATTMPATTVTITNNGTAFSTLASADARIQEVVNTFFNGDNIGDNTAITPDTGSGNFANGNFLRSVFAQTDSAILSKAVVSISDSSSFAQLSDDTKLSVAVDDIPAVTNGLAAFTRITVFTSTGELEPGSTISVTSSSGDSVVVPVTDDGNFIAQIRGDNGDTLTVQQFPRSAQSDADQVVILDAEDQNLEPTLLSAVSQNFAEIGTITQQGTAPVLFKLSAVGRVGADVFKPTAADLRIGGDGVVYAVPGSDDLFLAIVDFRKTDGDVVSAPNIAGAPEVVISGLDTDFPTFNKRTRPILRRARTRTKKNGDTRVVFRGKRLRNAGVGFLVLDDGTVDEVTFRRRTRNDRSKNRVVSEGTDSIPSNAAFAVYHVPGRGISTLDITGN
jgi:hypothetical protein